MSATRYNVLRLYKTLLRESQCFHNYNFRNYALRRIRDAFKANKNIQDCDAIEAAYNEAFTTLAIIKRQVVVSDLYKGKSSLALQLVEEQFVDSYDPAIKNTFTKLFRVCSQDYEVNLVDTAGQDEYSIFPAQYFMDIHGYVLVYSITSAKSFEVIQVI